MYIINRIEQLKAEYENARQALIAELKPEFHELFRWYLEKYPYIQSLHFTAYIPYFNDGETCEYRVNELCVSMPKGEEGLYEDYDEDDNASVLPYGIHADDIISYRRDGHVTFNMDSFSAYYCKPRQERQCTPYNGYSQRYGEYVTVPPRYKSLDSFLKDHYPWMLDMSIEQLETLPQAEEDLGRCQSILESIPDDVMREIFGDHAKVIIARDHITVEDYDHE